jgi:hypothetical protein
VADLLTAFPGNDGAQIRFSGGLLGQWAVWTKRAVGMMEAIKACDHTQADQPPLKLRRSAEALAKAEAWACDRGRLLAMGARLTDANAALFDARNAFAGCIAGIHEVLRRQGLLEGIWCLNPHEGLSPGQKEEIDRVTAAYPDLQDDAFVAENLDRWLS